ncbi:MAG TPA: tetratricopeptide repeat protein [Micropepsaceae bacterium]|nr:tetratricopeptide repeat protein [Micropepsaceae bacterium]
MKIRTILLLAAGVGALSLAGCSSTATVADLAPHLSGPPASNALAGTSASLAGTYLAGNFAAAEGDVKAATEFYSNTLKDAPDNADILERTFLFAAEGGEMGRAAALANRVIAIDPENRPAHLVLQVGALTKKDYAAAIKDATGPANGLFATLTNKIMEAWARAGMKDIDGALAALDSLSNQRGIDGLRLMHTALILDYAGRDKEAEDTYNKAIAAMGTGPRGTEAYGRFLLRHGRVNDAKALFERANRENRGNPFAQWALSDLSTMKNPAPLISSPAQGVAEGLFGIAASLNDQRSTDVAILYLNLALYLRPDFDLGRVLLASHYEAMEKYAIANAIYAGIAPASPYYAMTQVQAAINDGRDGKPQDGIVKLKALSASQPQESDVWTALGDLFRSSDQYKEAAAAYDKAIAGIPPGDRRLTGLYYARGVSFEHSDRWPDAERDFQAALKINPDRADVLNYLGFSWIEKGQHLDQALQMLEKARALRPMDGFIADSVGWAYFRLGRFQDAVHTLEEAVQLAPGAADVNDHLGDAYWRVGRKVDARYQWNHALAMQPDAGEKPILERKLQFGLDAVSASGK